MIISKKKFERLVEEEVCKRMNAIDERRWQQERFNRFEEFMHHSEAKIQELIEKYDKLERMTNVALQEARYARKCELGYI